MAAKSKWYPVLLTATGIALAGGAYYYFVWRPKQAGKITPAEEGGSGGGGGMVGGSIESTKGPDMSKTASPEKTAKKIATMPKVIFVQNTQNLEAKPVQTNML